MGTTGAKDQSIAFGANCVLLKAEYTNPYVQVSPQQIQALQHQYLEPYQAGSSFSGSVLSQVGPVPATNPWDYIQTQAQDPVEHHIRPSPHQTEEAAALLPGGSPGQTGGIEDE